MTLSEISSHQAAPAENTMKHINHFLDYMWTHPDAVIRYRVSDMILNIHSDASYLSAPKAHSRAGGYFFLGSLPRNGDLIKLNGTTPVQCTILKLVAASAAEAKLGALFLNAQDTKVFDYSLPNLAIHNRPPQYTSTTQQQSVLSTTPSNVNNHDQWKCNISGY
jgi:hypothetical protein